MFHFMEVMKKVKPFEETTGEHEDTQLNDPLNSTKPNLNSGTAYSSSAEDHYERAQQTGEKKRVSWDQENEGSIRLEKEEKALKRRVFCIMLTLYALAFLASFSYWVQSGVLPYLTRRVGMNTELFGLMESSYAFYQMITSPIYGRLGDLFGIRILYMLSEICSSVTFGSLAFANSVPALFLTRLPALFMHSVQCSYMILTDISTKRKRADLIGKLGVLHGVGMICGSVTGGLITHAFDEKTAAIVAAISNLISVLIIFVFIPQNTKDIRRQVTKLQERNTSPKHATKNRIDNQIDENYKENQNTSSNDESGSETEKSQETKNKNQNENESESTPTLKAMVAVLQFKNVKFLLLIKILIAFPFSLLYSMFSMAIMDYYQLGPRVNGLILGYIGILTIIVQGVIVGIFTKRFTDAFIVKTMIFVNTIGFLFLVVSTQILILAFVVIPLAIGGSVSHIVLLAVMTKIVPPEHSGTALGFIFALHAIVRAVTPTLGGLTFATIGWPFFGVIGYVFNLVLLVYVTMCGRDEQYDS